MRVSKLCERVVCEREREGELCVSKLCVCVIKLCVRKKVPTEGDRRRHNKKQEPPTQRCGE